MDWKEFFKLVNGTEVDLCRHCGEGRLVQIGVIPPQRPPPGMGFTWRSLEGLEN